MSAFACVRDGGRTDVLAEAMFPATSDAVRSRSVITFTQIGTFLALVREGSVVRAAASLGLGRSTVSAHAKLVADDIGHQHFRRSNSARVLPTEAGLETYNRFRTLLAHATFCARFFRSGRATPTFTPILLPSGFPGSLLDRAVDRIAAQLAMQRPDICLLPTYVRDNPAAGDLGFTSGATGTLSAADRWLLIRAGRQNSDEAAGVGLDALADVKLHAPHLPADARARLSALATQAKTTVAWSDDTLAGVLAEIALTPGTAAIIPASLFNPSLVDEQFTVARVETTHLDPVLAVTGGAFPDIARLLRDAVQASLDQPSGVPFPVPQTRPLSLKYCRSFMVLYEEGNVGRAARRLSIVQPALTVQLHHIEAQAGCRLFDRSHQGLRATDRAAALHHLLRPLMARFSATLRHLRATADKRAMPIRIGMIPALDDESLMSQGFAAALHSWSRQHPDDVLRVMEGYSGTLMRWLQRGLVDFALVDRYVADPDLALEVIVEDTLAVVTSAASGLLPPGPVSLGQVPRLPLLLPSSRHGLRTLLMHSLGRHGLTLQPRIEVDSMAACLNLVKIGDCATILPTGSVNRSRHRRGLAIHEIKDPQIVRSVCLARARSKPYRDAETAFLVELRQAFASPALHTGQPLLPFLAAMPLAS
ncbi:LysR substrate-binding domain-containing protein [Reyranella sp. CPCC 100927]|uniref:LysR substrate-binding domain-containing protein n=1 Tax=Reyranella sp. CPCC 100927 TaxID=2599616 RepID=UPI0011B7F26F|nr:LysR substrate-binding domain-containing protein [Reyranella sp. CPCC 100927]TWT02594.1 LysR family transcriptional regulator [Reyranella sp. CPCC 100927]